MSIDWGKITMQLSHPLTEEQWDTIIDVDFEYTDRIWFHTKHGKDVEFAKVVRCKDCKFYVEHSLFGVTQGWCERFCDEFDRSMARGTNDDDFCSHGEKKVEE